MLFSVFTTTVGSIRLAATWVRPDSSGSRLLGTKKVAEKPKVAATRKRRSASRPAPKPVAELSVPAVESPVAELEVLSDAIALPEDAGDSSFATVPDQPIVAVDEAAAVENALPEDLAAVPEENPATDATPALTDAEGNPISILDEEQLILLLRRVIREELQGSLGEKITRNVRKLVRAEINRALTADTLE